MTMKKNKYNDKKPIELNPEEMIELISSITAIEYSRKKDILLYETTEDGAYDIYTHLFGLSKRGKRGLKELQSECTMAHFINVLHMECRNHINYILRMKKTKRLLFDTKSLESTIENDDDRKLLIDLIPDTKSLDEIENLLELDSILNKIDDTENSSILIRYDTNKTEKFSYRKLTKLYYNESCNKKLNSKHFKDLLIDAETKQSLSDKEIKQILTDFKQYYKDIILGGELN